MSQNNDLDEKGLDRLCWLMVSWRNRFAPPNETAEECLDHNEPTDAEAVGHEHGYHEGMFIAFNEMIEQFYAYGINVMARANRFTKVNRDAGWEFHLDDEPDFYRTVERGAEVKAATSPLFNDVEIESLDWDEPGYRIEQKS